MRIVSSRLWPSSAANGRQIQRFNQAPSSVMAEPMRVNMRDIGATTEHCQQVSNTAIRVWPALAAENGPFGDNRPDYAEGLAHGRVGLRQCSIARGRWGPCPGGPVERMIYAQ